MKDKIVKVNLKKNYSIAINTGLLDKCNLYIKGLNIGKKILIVTQSKVPTIYISKVKNNLQKSGFTVFVLSIPSGEEYKNIDSLLKIVDYAIKNKFERNDSFIAIGGGVISDLTGFASSIYYRGVNFICIPTTLLGMVDASIGGKTSVNIKEGKNLLGTFHQPRIVLIDINCLKTLPKRELLIGMAEVIKYALLEKTAGVKYQNAGFYNYLRNYRKDILKLNSNKLLEIINHSAKVKANIVSKDEKESNLRAILNLGHTFAHGIEQAYNYKRYTHGEAVSIGICIAFTLASRKNLISKNITKGVIDLIFSYGLPVKLSDKSRLTKIMKSMLLDKKVKDGKLRFILPEKEIGKVKIVSGISDKEIRKVLIS